MQVSNPATLRAFGLKDKVQPIDLTRRVGLISHRFLDCFDEQFAPVVGWPGIFKVTQTINLNLW